jgi:hypothetical protein
VIPSRERAGQENFPTTKVWPLRLPMMLATGKLTLESKGDNKVRKSKNVEPCSNMLGLYLPEYQDDGASLEDSPVATYSHSSKSRFLRSELPTLGSEPRFAHSIIR